MKGAGGEQKGGGWEKEEEGEGVRANRLWRPHKDWPRTEGENREVGGNWGWGRGDPLLTCPRDRPPPGSRSAGWRGTERPSRSLPPCSSFPALNRDGPAPSSSRSSPSASFTPSPREAVPTFPPHISLVCSPTPPRGGPIWFPRFRVASPSPMPPVRLPPRPGPRLLIVQTQFSSLWLRPRVASGRPEPPPPNLEGERPGGARAGPPDTGTPPQP